MVELTFDIWSSICQMYAGIQRKYRRSYVQWFPFNLLAQKDWKILSSKEFFDKYIENGGFVYSSQIMFRTDNYMVKSDGNFRKATLLSPILYLILQSIGKSIANVYSPSRPKSVSAYYAGNYKEKRPYYKKDYDTFYKDIKNSSKEYQYFIKTDIQNFFSNINLNILISRIDSVCNSKDVVFSQTQLLVYKEILSYCGKGKFPLVENSMASSYLATIVYLDEADCKLHQYITDKIAGFSKFKMFRYVDDLYICFSSSQSDIEIKRDVQEICDTYISILKEYDLSLNSNKLSFKPMSKIREELKKSAYDEQIDEDKLLSEEIAKETIQNFLNNIKTLIAENNFDRETYIKCMEESFEIPNLEYIPSEAFNRCLFAIPFIFREPIIIHSIRSLVKIDKSFILADPKRLLIMVLNTKDEGIIKGVLKYLFEKDRTNSWNSYCTIIAIVYCIQRKFQHSDLLKVLKKQAQTIYQFYQQNCKESFLKTLKQEDDSFCRFFGEKISCLFYFMYISEKEKNNILASFSYFKNFFDRITAIFAFQISYKKRKKISFGGYYKLEKIIPIYKQIENSKEIIKKTDKLRNGNPLAHASAELWENNSRRKELQDLIQSLHDLIKKMIVINTSKLKDYKSLL